MYRVTCTNPGCAKNFPLEFPLGNQQIPCPYCGHALVAPQTSPLDLLSDAGIHRWNDDPTVPITPVKQTEPAKDETADMLNEWLKALEGDTKATEVAPVKPRPSVAPTPKPRARAKAPAAKSAPKPPTAQPAPKAEEPVEHLLLRDLVEGGHITVAEHADFLKTIHCPNSKCQKPIRMRRGKGVRLALCPHCGQAVTIGHSD
jgi:hypothetical protein